MSSLFSAIAGARTGSNEHVNGITNFVRKWTEILSFDISLRLWDLKIWFTAKCLQLMVLFNLAPVKKDIIQELTL